MPGKNEIWQNATQSTIVVWKTNVKGQMVTEVVGPGARLEISPEDRIYNAEVSVDVDVFKTGSLVNIILLDDSPDRNEIESNPNIMTDSQISELVKSHHKTFNVRINEISNLAVLERMASIAQSNDVTVTRMSAITKRLNEVRASEIGAIEADPVVSLSDDRDQIPIANKPRVTDRAGIRLDRV